MNQPIDHAKTIFLRALESHPPDQWEAYLDGACGGDAELRTRVADLLKAHLELGSFRDDAPAHAPTVTERSVSEASGTVIGPYKLLQQIGEGGMGVVYMAEQTHPMQRKVALKLIKAGMDSRQVIARFEAERQALALMDHVNIARVFDAGTTEAGLPYFVMELVHGVPITRYCDDNRLTPRERLELFVPVCQAIQHAHQKGLIHRDIKPSNVMITLYDGKPVPKVIDFGVAKATEQRLTERTLFTQYGTMVGTFEYMSPEQAEMSALGADTRSDIFSLGVLLYELLTGSTPLSHKRVQDAAYGEILRMIREEEPPRPSTRLTDSGEALASISAQRHTEPAKLSKLMRGELDWIVMKALEKDRNRRYETANGFASDVQRYLNDEPVAACPPSAGYRLRKFARRNKRPVLAVSLVVLALVGGIFGTTLGMIRATVAEADAVNEAQLKDDALTGKEAALAAAQHSERAAKDKLRLSLYEQARARRFSRQMGQRLDSLNALDKAAHIRPDAVLRDEAIAAMALPDIRRVPGWHCSPFGTTTIALGGRYRIYARTDNQGFISIRSLPDDREIRRIASGPLFTGNNLYFSADERFLLGITQGRTLHVWRVADGQPALRDELSGSRLANSFSPDGRQLAVGQQNEVLCFNLETGQEVKRWRLPALASALAFHPDNGKLAVGYVNARTVSIYDAASGDLLAELPVGSVNFQTVAWHPDGERLAVAGSDPRIQIWNVAAKRKVATLEGHVQNVEVLTFHPEGGLLASHSWDGVLRLWDPSIGQAMLQLPLTVADRPRFSGDGRWLGAALHGGQAELLEVKPSREYRTLVGSTGVGGSGDNQGDISPDGRLLALAIESGAGLWDLRSGRKLAALPGGTNSVSFDNQGEGEGSPVKHNSPRWCLLTSGSDGLMRWAVTSDDPQGKRLRLGPPRQLSQLKRAWFARGPDGRTLGVVTELDGANKILDLKAGTVRLELGIHPQGEVRALSGDGRWAASYGWHSDRVRLWNAATGQMVHEWVQGKRTTVYFTPDSRALVISKGDEFSFYDVESLQPIRRLTRDVAQFPGHVAFSQDGHLMALEMAPTVIHLKEVATGRTVAQLEDPHGDRAGWMDFTPDGTQLVVVAKYASATHIWDLRAIRRRLKGMGLDWEWPEFPPAATRNRAAEPVTIEVLPVERAKPDTAAAHFELASALALSEQWDQSASVYAAALERFGTLLWPGPWYVAIRSDEVFTRLTALQPDDRRPWIMRARLHVLQRDWRRAEADYARINESRASIAQAKLLSEADDLVGHACLLLLLGDHPGYEQFCKRWADRVGHAQGWEYGLARAWAISPRTVVPSQQIVECASKTVQVRQDPWCLHVLSLAHYRNGESDVAIKHATESNAGNWRGSAKALNWLVLAMAHHRLGHTAEAQTSLEQACLLAGQASPKQPPGVQWPDMAPTDVVAFELLRREAEELTDHNSTEKADKDKR